MGTIGKSYPRQSHVGLPSQNAEAVRRFNHSSTLENRPKAYEIALAVVALFGGLALVGWLLAF